MCLRRTHLHHLSTLRVERRLGPALHPTHELTDATILRRTTMHVYASSSLGETVGKAWHRRGASDFECCSDV
jgi:hypothetical protein